jgi:hypothetical protein
MISVKQWRIKDGQEFDQSIPDVTTFEALKRMIRYEIGYGGSIVDIGEDMVHIQTKIMDCEDHTVFKGEPNEMVGLIGVAYLVLELHAKQRERMIKNMHKVSHIILGEQAGNPLYLKMAVNKIQDLTQTGMLDKGFKAIILISQGITDESLLEKSWGIPLIDLIDILEIVETDNISFSDAIEYVA